MITARFKLGRDELKPSTESSETVLTALPGSGLDIHCSLESLLKVATNQLKHHLKMSEMIHTLKCKPGCTG